MLNTPNTANDSYFSRTLEESLKNYHYAAQTLKLLQEKSFNSEDLQFENQVQEKNFFIGLSHIQSVLSKICFALKKDLVFAKSEVYSNEEFSKRYEKKTGHPYTYPESRLYAYDLLINRSFSENFAYTDRMNEEVYNKNANNYNQIYSTSNIRYAIESDKDNEEITRISTDFDGLNKQLVIDFFKTLHSILPTKLPLIHNSQTNHTIDKSKLNLLETIQ